MKILPIERLDARKDAALRRAGYLTFDGWSARGRKIRKGEKSTERNSRGTPLFHHDQTGVYSGGGQGGGKEYNDDAMGWLGLTAHDMGADF